MRACRKCETDISARHWNAKLCVSCFDANKKAWHSRNKAAQNAKRKHRRREHPERYNTSNEKQRVANGKKYRENIDVRNKHRDRNRLRRTGCTPEKFAELMEAQQGRCAICSSVMKKPCVDHCHSTGKIRELLCAKCNSGIGQLQDSLDLVRSAASYLEKHLILQAGGAIP